MSDAVLVTSGSRPVLRFERHLRASPERVWRSITDPSELTGWFPCDVEAESWTVGAAIRFVFRQGEGPELMGVVLECDEPRVLAFTWGPETLRFELEPDGGGGTRLVFSDELDPPFAARNAAGWEVCLAALDPQAPVSESWQSRFEHYTGAFSPSLGNQEGPPGRG
jgi:uncharacterized protein YndB with AHSA1/START domain